MRFLNISFTSILVFFSTFNAMQKESFKLNDEMPFIQQAINKYKLPEALEKANKPDNKHDLRMLCLYLINADENFNQCNTKEFNNFLLEKTSKEEKRKYAQFLARTVSSPCSVINITHHIKLIATKEDWTPIKTGNIITEYLEVIGSLQKKHKH